MAGVTFLTERLALVRVASAVVRGLPTTLGTSTALAVAGKAKVRNTRLTRNDIGKKPKV